MAHFHLELHVLQVSKLAKPSKLLVPAVSARAGVDQDTLVLLPPQNLGPLLQTGTALEKSSMPNSGRSAVITLDVDDSHFFSAGPFHYVVDNEEMRGYTARPERGRRSLKA